MSHQMGSGWRGILGFDYGILPGPRPSSREAHERVGAPPIFFLNYDDTRVNDRSICLCELQTTDVSKSHVCSWAPNISGPELAAAVANAGAIGLIRLPDFVPAPHLPLLLFSFILCFLC